MKNWKKNAVVASILVFVCAGIYLNWMYTQDQETANPDRHPERGKDPGQLHTGDEPDRKPGGRRSQGGPAGGLWADDRLLCRRPPQPPAIPGQRRFHLTGRPCPMARTPRPPPPPRSWRVW